MTQTVLKIGLFGQLDASLDGESLSIASAAARSLLAYLVLSPGRSVDRGRLAAMIWEHADQSRSRQNLRQALHALGRVLGPDWAGIIADRSSVALDSASLVTDIEQTLAAVVRGEVPETLMAGRQLPAQLLADEPLRGDLFESWLRLQQQVYEDRLRNALARLLESAKRPTARNAARALLAIDRADEQAVRFLMRDYHATGQTARALSTYEDLWRHLDEEYDAEPGAETQALIAQIKMARPATPLNQPAPTAERLKIGVLLETAGGTAATSGVAQLFHRDLLATLLRFRTFEIVDLSQVQDQVDYVLGLSVAQAGDDLLLLAVLTRTRDGVALWSERWSGLNVNWLATQAAVVSRLTSALSIHVSLSRLRDLQNRTFDGRAFDDWLLGNMHLDEFRPEGWQAAAACFRRVIEKAPEASMGYSSLARMNNGVHLMQPGLIRDRRTHAESKAAATKAVSLDPLDSRAHLHRAWACCLLGEYDQASAGFEMARQCNPNDPWTILSSALGAAFSDDVQLATKLSARVIAEGWTTEPFQWGFHATIRFVCGDDEGCLAALENAGNAIINLPAWKAAALWSLGRRDEACAAWAEFAALSEPGWTGERPFGAEALCDWFLSCFPIRSTAQRQRLKLGAMGAAGL